MEDLLIKHLSEGKTQAEIAVIFKCAGIKPNSVSSIEKCLKGIKKRYGAKTMFHLGAIISKNIDKK